jgi:hypothetical protein
MGETCAGFSKPRKLRWNVFAFSLNHAILIMMLVICSTEKPDNDDSMGFELYYVQKIANEGYMAWRKDERVGIKPLCSPSSSFLALQELFVFSTKAKGGKRMTCVRLLSKN